MRFLFYSIKDILYFLTLTFSVLISSCGGGGNSSLNEPLLPPDPQPTTLPTPEIPLSERKYITQNIDGQQVERTYLIRYPEEISKSSYPVVFFFHGAGGNGQGWFNNHPEVENLIDQEQFIGIFPDGYENRWNVGTETNADDVEFITLIVNDFGANELFNTEKLYGVGNIIELKNPTKRIEYTATSPDEFIETMIIKIAIKAFTTKYFVAAT